MAHTHIAPLPRSPATVRVVDDGVHIEHLVVADPVLADFLESFPPDRRPAELEKVLAVGVRGITAMGAGATVKGVGEEIERVLESVTRDSESRVKEIMESGQAVLAGKLDPEIRSSLTARALDEIESVHRELLNRLDPERKDSHSARLVADLTALLGPDGLLRERLRETFDPGSDESAMARLLATIDARFRDMRELMVGAQERSVEAARGTAKGLEYEEEIVEQLRGAAAEIGGCTVEATGQVTGGLDALAKVGDAVLALPDGTRIAVEVKNTARIALEGKNGILEELDRAMANRDAAWSVCVSKNDVFPAEVGAFGIYGNRVLVVDDGDGVMLRVALRWVRACATFADTDASAVDTETVRAGLDRLRSLAKRFTGTKRSLSGVRSSIDQVRSEIDALRTDLLDLVDDMHVAIRAGRGAADDPGDL